MARRMDGLRFFVRGVLNLVCENNKLSLGRISLWLVLIPTVRILWAVPASNLGQVLQWPVVTLLITLILIFSSYNFLKKDQFANVMRILASRAGNPITNIGGTVNTETNTTEDSGVVNEHALNPNEDE